MNYDCYLGCNTYKGFVSLFSELYDPFGGWHLYIIKGGPGTGKSTFMKRIAEEAENHGLDVQRVHCSSDPSSLDAVIIPQIKISVADGTSPHTLEPRYPGLTETIINPGDCWDKNVLSAGFNDIVSFYGKNAEKHRECIRYLSEAEKIRKTVCRTVIPYVNEEKIGRFIVRTVLKYFKMQKKPSEIRKIMISAITPEGVKVFDGITDGLTERVVIEDRYGCIAPIIMENIAIQAYERHYDVIKCCCPTSPDEKTDHVIIPELKLGFFTSNGYHTFSATSKTVRAERFISPEIREKRNYISDSEKLYNECIGNAVNSLKKAKEIHDIIESYYIKAMDYKKLNDKNESIIKEILSDVSRET